MKIASNKPSDGKNLELALKTNLFILRGKKNQISNEK